MMNRRLVNIIKALAYLLAFFIIITMVTSLIFAVNLFTGSNSQTEMQSIYKDDKIINKNISRWKRELNNLLEKF